MPAAKFQIERKSELCGETFLAKTITSRYCSIQCSRSAYSQKEARGEVGRAATREGRKGSQGSTLPLYLRCYCSIRRLQRYTIPTRQK